MNVQPKAKIFLADKRGCNETGWFRSYRTFNFGEYFNEHKYHFGNLYALNDETIAASHFVTLHVTESSYVLLLPVVGTLRCKINGGNISVIDTGQLQIFKASPGDLIELQNGYENELINFIEVLIKEEGAGLSDISGLFSFQLDHKRDQLINVTGPAVVKAVCPVISIGKFTGRGETVYKLNSKQNALFFFVIEGVFDVGGRLLHARDGLGLYNEAVEIELEALSSDAIMLIIEMDKMNC